MRILTDVHIHSETVERLIREGFKIRRGDTPNIRNKGDKELLLYAQKRNLIILTEDKDFLNLAGEEDHSGIIFITKRERPKDSVRKMVKIAKLIEQKDMENQILYLSDW